MIIELDTEQYERRRRFNKYLRRLKRMKQLIIDNKCKQRIKNEPLKTTLDIEFKY